MCGWKRWGGVRSYGVPMGFGVYLKPSLSLSLLMVLNVKIITVLGYSLLCHHPYFCIKVRLNHRLAEINKTLNMKHVDAGEKTRKL